MPLCALVELEGGRSAQTVGCPVMTSGRLGSILVWPSFLSPVTKVPSGPSIPLTRKTKQNPPAEAPEAGRASTSPHVGVSVQWSLCVLSPPLLHLFAHRGGEQGLPSVSHPSPCSVDPPWLRLSLQALSWGEGASDHRPGVGRKGRAPDGLAEAGGVWAGVSVCVCMYGQLLTHTAQLTLYPQICLQWTPTSQAHPTPNPRGC